MIAIINQEINKPLERARELGFLTQNDVAAIQNKIQQCIKQKQINDRRTVKI